MRPGTTDGNQIDHILIAKKWERIINDTRSYRGANADSDHYLVMTKIKMKIIRETAPQMKSRWDTWKLNEDHTKQKYVNKLNEKLITERSNKMEEEWTTIKESIIDTAKK